MAYLAQSAAATFNPAITIGEQVTESAVLHGILSQEEATKRAVELYHALELPDADRIGFRICPGNPYNDLHDDDPEETFRALLASLGPLGLAYCHTIRMPSAGLDNEQLCRQAFDGPLIINDSYWPLEANEALADGRGDAVAFGRLFITNPDLAERIRAGSALASTDAHHIYDPGPEGYIDFPSVEG